MARRPIPHAVRREVLIEAGYRCAIPTCRTILAIDLHHVIRVADDGGNAADNLIALCPTCHALHHRGEIPAEAIRVWKGMLVTLNRAFDKDVIDDLLFLSAPPSNLNYTDDGVLTFRRLIAARLVEISSSIPRLYGSGQQTQEKTHRLRLTDKGRMVVEAWKAGDKDALARALAEGAGPD